MRRAWVVFLLVVPGAAAPVQALDLNHLPAWVRTSLSPLVIDWRQLQRDSTAPALPTPLATGSLSTVHSGRYTQPPSATGAAPVAPTPPAVSTASGVVPGSASVSLASGAVAGPLSAPSAPWASSPLAPVHTGAALPSPVGSTATSLNGLRGVAPDSSATPAAPNASLKTVGTPGLTAQLRSNPAAAQTLLLRIKTLMDGGQLDAAGLPRWLAEQKVESPALIAALDQMTLQHPMDPLYLPICQVLWGKLGTGLEEYLKFPYRARIIMGIYLGVLEREEDAKKLLSSVPDEWQKQDPTVPMYHVANELAFYAGPSARSPRLAIWAWKRAAPMRGPAEEAFVCSHIGQTCRRVTDDAAARDMALHELIPWALGALEKPGSEARWDYAIHELLWAEDLVGHYSEGASLGLLWLARAEARRGGCASSQALRVQTARLCARAGQEKMAQSMVPARLERVTPDSGQLYTRLGESAACAFRVWGSATLSVLAASVTGLPGQAAVGDTQQNGDATFCDVTLRISPAHGDGQRRGALLLRTNDASHPALRLDIVQTALPPVRLVDPRGLCLPRAGQTDGGTRHSGLVLSSSLPFSPAVQAVEPAGALDARLFRVSQFASVLRVTPARATGPGATQATIRVLTGLEAQPLVVVPVRFE